MGNRQNTNHTLSDNDIRLFSQQTQLEPHIVQQLYEAFIERSGRDGRMTLSDFKRIYTEINPRANVFDLDNEAERTFMTFDIDRNGVLTFNEFARAYISLQNVVDNPENQWQTILNSMPVGIFTRPGFLNSAEAYIVLERLGQSYKIQNFDPVLQHNLLWSQLNSQLDPMGYISQAEYLRILMSQPYFQQRI